MYMYSLHNHFCPLTLKISINTKYKNKTEGKVKVFMLYTCCSS